MNEKILSEKQIYILKELFKTEYKDLLYAISCYYGYDETLMNEVEAWIDHGKQIKPLYLVLIYEYVKEYEREFIYKNEYLYNKYRF